MPERKPGRRIFSLVQGPPEGVPLRSPRPDSFAETCEFFLRRHPLLEAAIGHGIFFFGGFLVGWWVFKP